MSVLLQMVAHAGERCRSVGLTEFSENGPSPE